MSFQVSVIIPVYNAEKYVRQAVESAVVLVEVGEIILVEDKSPDNALEVCKRLENEFEKVKLFQHLNGENKGAGASRNLGIKRAKCEYIAFLDADDIYLENRFSLTKIKFDENAAIDGVYECIGYMDQFGHRLEKKLTISKPISSKNLFHYLLRGTYGHFSTIAVTFKKDAFEKAGVFNEDLPLHQDAELWLRMAFHCKLIHGNLIEAVSVARQHKLNRIIHANKDSRLVYWSEVKVYFSKHKIGIINRLLIDRKIAKLKQGSFLNNFIKEVFDYT